MDQKTDLTKLWRTIKGIDGRAKHETENEAIIFNGSLFSPSKSASHQVQPKVKHFKVGKHTSSSKTRIVTRETKRKPLDISHKYSPWMRFFRSFRNSNAFTPDKLIILHMKHLGPRAIEYITAIWKSSLFIPIPKPGKDTVQGTSYRPISFLWPAASLGNSAVAYYQ